MGVATWSSRLIRLQRFDQLIPMLNHFHFLSFLFTTLHLSSNLAGIYLFMTCSYLFWVSFLTISQIIQKTYERHNLLNSTNKKWHGFNNTTNNSITCYLSSPIKNALFIFSCCYKRASVSNTFTWSASGNQTRNYSQALFYKISCRSFPASDVIHRHCSCIFNRFVTVCNAPTVHNITT